MASPPSSFLSPSVPRPCAPVDLPRVRGLASQLAATRLVIASWLPPRGDSNGGGTSSGNDGRLTPQSSQTFGGSTSSASATASRAGDPPSNTGSDSRCGPEPPFSPFDVLTPEKAATMPEYALLGRSARARSWLSDLWDPGGGPPPVSPPLDPSALARSVVCERLLRFPAPCMPAPGEEDPSFVPGDEADGSGLGPALTVLSMVSIPVEAPPLTRWWTAAAGGNALSGSTGNTAAVAAMTDVHATSYDEDYDEDDEVVTAHVVIDAHRDLLPSMDTRLSGIQPLARGVFHRRTGEMMSLMSAAAPPGSPVKQQLTVDYTGPDVDGSFMHLLTTMGVDESGRLGIISRSSAVMVPATPRPPPTFRPTDGVTALATAMEQMSGSFGLAYAPCLPGPAKTASPSGDLPPLLSLVLTSSLSSVAATFRMRRLAAALLVPPVAPRGAPAFAICPPPATGDERDMKRDGVPNGRRSRRRRIDLDSVTSAAERSRIMRNRAAAARSNAARKAAREASLASGVGTPEGSEGTAMADAATIAGAGLGARGPLVPTAGYVLLPRPSEH